MKFAVAHPLDVVRARWATGPEVVVGAVRVGPDGVFISGQKVAEVGEFVEQVMRADVSVIEREVKKGSNEHNNQHGTSFCGKCAESIYFGGTIGLGLLGYHAMSRTVQEVIYRRP